MSFFSGGGATPWSRARYVGSNVERRGSREAQGISPQSMHERTGLFFTRGFPLNVAALV